MARFVKAIAIAAACVGYLFLLFATHVDRDIGHGDQNEIEKQIRAALPLGSSVSRVEEFLSEKGIQHSFESSSKTEYAVVRKTKGSNIVIIKSLTLQFHFDNALKLESVETNVRLTGP